MQTESEMWVITSQQTVTSGRLSDLLISPNNLQEVSVRPSELPDRPRDVFSVPA